MVSALYKRKNRSVICSTLTNLLVNIEAVIRPVLFFLEKKVGESQSVSFQTGGIEKGDEWSYG